MLSPADRDLAVRDPALPGLATVLDEQAVADRLADAVPGAPSFTARAEYVRYKPGTSCVVGYRLDAPGGALHAYVKTHWPDGREKLAKIVETARAKGPWGPGAVHLDADVALSFLPNDRELTTGRTLGDADRRRRLLQQLLPDRPDTWEHPIHVVRYKPERRLVARLDGADGPAAVLKWYAEDEFAQADAATRVFSSAGPLRIMRRLGSSARHRVVAVEWLDARTLDDDAGACLETFEVVGHALARLHGQPGDGLADLKPAIEDQRLEWAAQAVTDVSPPLAPLVRNLCVRVRERLSVRRGGPTPVHGDFSPDQVLIAGGAAAVIDYDGAAIGDPASDLGLFRASLLAAALDGRTSRELAEARATALRRGYDGGQAQPQPALDGRVGAYAAMWLVRLAPEPFRYRRPGWPGRTAAFLHEAARVLDG